MSDANFNIEAVDHIELRVTNKAESVRWYKWVFGLDTIIQPETHTDAGQPALIRIGDVTLAIYQSNRTGNNAPCIGIQRVAFRTDGDGFLAMLNHLDSIEIPLHDDKGDFLKPKRAVDHGDAFSVYFTDFDCNKFEVVTYEYDYVKERIPIFTHQS